MGLLGRNLKCSIVAFLIVLTGCTEEVAEKKQQQKASPQTIETPNFNQDSALSYVKKQVDFGPRVPNSEAHDLCRDWLVQSFERMGCNVQLQSGVQLAHDGKKLQFSNIIASYEPELEKRILISAHWDSRPWGDHDPDEEFHSKAIDGANDGASGVGVMLELARVLNKANKKVGIDFVMFDIEDYGISEVANSFCYGSQYWSKNPPYKGKLPYMGINLDMVGDSTATYAYEGFSRQYARHVLDKVWLAAKELGHDKVFVTEMDGPVYDDHLYVNQLGIPCIDIIHRDLHSGGFAPTWHTHEDNIDNIYAPMLKIVGETLLRVIYKEQL